MSDENTIKVDIDCDRIRESVVEIVRAINEFYGKDYIDRSKVLNQLGMILKSGRVSVMFFLDLQNEKIPDLQLSVEPRRKRFLLRSSFKKRIKPLNHFVRVL
jgi:hypothetical protein